MNKICNCSNKKRKREYRKKEKEGYGLIDYIVNKLPEIHIPGYQYCGPGTELEKRLARGDPGINKLDQACKAHDIAYSTTKNSKGRREADKALVAQALPRIYSSDAKLDERAAALLVSGLMGAKIGLSKFGLGFQRKNRKLRTQKKRTTMKGRRRVKVKKTKAIRKNKRSKIKRKSITFNKLLAGAKTSVKKSNLKSTSLNDTIKAAICSVKNMKRNKVVKVPRVLKVPKFGGSVLSVLPLISVLSGVGAISSSAAAVIKAIKAIQSAKSDASGQVNKKIGRGLNLLSNASGSGFFLRPHKQH